MKIKPVKTAVVGCGMISDIYLRNMIEQFSILEVVACCSKGGASAKAKAEKYGIRACTFEEILADPEIELIVNLTPAPEHEDIVRRALLSGKHVYTEKILTPGFEEGKALVELSQEKGLYLGSAPDTFLGRAVQTARLAVEQGLIGKVTSCHANVNRDLRTFYRPGFFLVLPGGGIGFDLGIYYLTVLLSLLGPDKQACGFTVTHEPNRQVEDPALENFGEKFTLENENVMVGSLVFENGVLGTLNFNGCCIWPMAPHLTLYGTEGILYLPDPNNFGGEVLWQKKGSEEKIVLPPAFGYGENSRGLGAAEMAWAIRGGREHRASSEMALHALEVLTGIAECEEKGIRKMTTTFKKPCGLKEGYLDDYRKQSCEISIMK